MKHRRRVPVLIALVLLSFLFFYFSVPRLPTALISLTEKKSSETHDIPKSAQDTPAITSVLSYKVIQPTELWVEYVSGKALPCPLYSFLEFKVSNLGEEPAERVFAQYPGSLKVLDCINCSLFFLSPGEEKIVRLKACGDFENEFFVEFYSINAGKKTIELDS